MTSTTRIICTPNQILTYYQISRVENNDSAAEDDRRKAETVVEDPISADIQFEEVSILVRSQEVILHLSKNRAKKFTAKKVKTADSDEEKMRNLEVKWARLDNFLEH